MNAKEWAWASYDVANSAFPTIISTFVIATYFTASVAASQSCQRRMPPSPV